MGGGVRMSHRKLEECYRHLGNFRMKNSRHSGNFNSTGQFGEENLSETFPHIFC